MKNRRILGLFMIGMFSALSAWATDPRTSFDTQVSQVVAKINREVQVDAEGSMLIADLVRREYGISEDELKWAIDHSVSWGEIVALAYIQATTGRSFAKLTREEEDARRDFWRYADNAEMDTGKMARSLQSFLKLAEKERNSRIFDRLRVTRRVQPMPDLGSGFGLFQEALDFRRIDLPRPTKIHTATGGSAKGGQ